MIVRTTMDENKNKNNQVVLPESTDTCAKCAGEGCRCPNDIGRCNLTSTNWLEDVPDNDFDIVEVLFKNTRRGFYRNSTHIPLKQGDWVAVEANPGHDIGRVGLTGRLVKNQMKRVNLRKDAEILRVFRKAKPADMERYELAKAREEDTMIRSRKIAVDLGLKMKIGDVEYQGDGNKAIFYYIADERVDFRQLIKVLAEAFRVRIEMRQIGARQEAGRIGGIGPCGRELCCATWVKNFNSVSTAAARFQDIAPNPQKLAGQCAKLKCCLNYEVDQYMEAQQRLPSREIQLETTDGIYYFFKADILSGQVTYSSDRRILANAVTISAERAFEVLRMNREGLKPESLNAEATAEPRSNDLLEQESVTRFDNGRSAGRRAKHNGRRSQRDKRDRRG